MNNRHPKYLERYEDVVLDLETALVTNVANNAHRKKDGYKFVADKSGEVTPFDWFHSRLSVDFKVNKLADGTAIAANDHNGIVNGNHSFIQKLDVKMNGREVYDCSNANHVVNIKTLLEYSPGYASSTATNECFYLDASRSAEERVAQADSNKGFAARKLLLGASATVNTEVTLNRYSFFERLQDKLLPNSKLEINLKIESNGNLIWQAGADCRVLITKMQLIVPRLLFNREGQKLYMSNKWTYIRENIETSGSLQQRSGNFSNNNRYFTTETCQFCLHNQ